MATKQTPPTPPLALDEADADALLAKVAQRVSSPPTRDPAEDIGYVDLPEGRAGVAKVTAVLDASGRPTLQAPSKDARTVADARKMLRLDVAEGKAQLEGFLATVDALDPEVGMHVRAKVLTAETRVREGLGNKALRSDGTIDRRYMAERAKAAAVSAVNRAEAEGKPVPDLDTVEAASVQRTITSALRDERHVAYWTLTQAVASASVLAQESFEAGKAARLRARAARRPMTPLEREMVDRAHAAREIYRTSQDLAATIPPEGEGKGPRS